ncbi:golgin subfamily A member 6-like protein 25 [Brachyistius frenatus]|uniref:golgin subfamily A member 6-like protein 25 n=1 Tax=Brachyistius frenatus TaxID=100188 RepID=UPI0037E8A7A9
MSIRAKSHQDLQTVGKASPDDSSFNSFSVSSSNVTGGSRFGNGVTEEVKALPRPTQRPVRAVRPVSAAGYNGTFLQINHLQGELVRKRKMKQKLYHSQQRAALCSRAADEAEEFRGEAEKSRALAEARALGSHRDKDAAEADRDRLSGELLQRKKEHTDLQLLLAQTEKNYFETQLKLDRVSAEKQVLLQENRSLQGDRDDLRHQLRHVTRENVQLKESERTSRRRAMASEEESNKASQAQREAEAERRRAEKDKQERTLECLSWREKHRELDDTLRAQEDLKAQRQNKACQANIKSYFLCMTESDQRVKILKNTDGSPRNFTEGDPVYISTPESSSEEPERSSSRTMLRVSAPNTGREGGQSHFEELPAFGGERPDSAPPRRSRKVVEYFWIPTDQE